MKGKVSLIQYSTLFRNIVDRCLRRNGARRLSWDVYSGAYNIFSSFLAGGR